MRDGFLSGLGDSALRENHEAVRQGLEVSLGESPARNPSDAATLDLLEEIVHHTLQSGNVSEAWDIYKNRIGGFRNLGWRLGAYERGERICRAFAGNILLSRRAILPFREADCETPYQYLPEAEQANFLNSWALFLSQLGRLDAAAWCYELHNQMVLRQTSLENASIGHQNLSDTKLLSGRLTVGLATAAEALQLAELAEDAEEMSASHAYLAHAHALRGEVPAAVTNFRLALELHDALGRVPKSQLRSIWGIQHAHLLASIGCVLRARRASESNKIALLSERGSQHQDIPKCNLILSDLHCEAGDFEQAETLHSAAHDWAMARDAKEVLCWSVLVQARIELAKLQSHSSGENRENRGNSAALSVPAFSSCSNALRDGLKIARDCGFGLFHIDLLLVRARLHLHSGEPQAALDDLRTALDVGIPADEQTGQPELLAATHAECGYAWAIAEGLSLRGEALLLQAANTLGQSTFAPDRRTKLPAPVRDLLTQAETCLTESLGRWQPLHNPEPEHSDQNFQLDGQPYNYRAAETHRMLVDLNNGVLCRALPVRLSPVSIIQVPSTKFLTSDSSISGKLKTPLGVIRARERVLEEKRQQELTATKFHRAKELGEVWRRLEHFTRESYHEQTGLDPNCDAFPFTLAPREYWLAKADLVVRIARFIADDPDWYRILKSLDRGDEWKQTAIEILEAGIVGKRVEIAEWLSELATRGDANSHDWPGNLVNMWLESRIREEMTQVDHERIFAAEPGNANAIAASTVNDASGIPNTYDGLATELLGYETGLALPNWNRVPVHNIGGLTDYDEQRLVAIVCSRTVGMTAERWAKLGADERIAWMHEAAMSRRKRTIAETTTKTGTKTQGNNMTSQTAVIPSIDPSTISIGIITALPKEFVAVKALLKNGHDYHIPGRGAGRRYVLGTIRSGFGGDHHVALAMADIGNNAAATRATLLLEHFKSVESILMVGIAGGVPSVSKPDDHVRLGDIVVSNKKGVVQYDMIKLSEIRSCPIAPSARLVEGVRHLEAAELEGKRPWDAQIELVREQLKNDRPNNSSDQLFDSGDPQISVTHPADRKRLPGLPRVFLGPIASANELLKDPIKRDKLRDQFGVKAVEMEGSGIADAAWMFEKGYLVVRGICDYCDSHKNDTWQEYAAAVAAGYAISLIESIPTQNPL